jgi:ubiquinone/menaquinone biosynthesis C-methylase UbiE
MLPEGYIENYEQIAQDYSGQVSTETQTLGKLVDYTVNLLGIPHDAKVLDVGCGNGWILNKAGTYDLYGLDISHHNCRLTREFSELHRVVQADAQAIPFKADTFDVVICTDLFEHVPNTARLVREIHRVLRRGGICLFGCPFEQDLSYYESRRYRRQYRYVHLRSVTRALLRSVFAGWSKMSETFVTEHMQEQEQPYPIIFQVYAKKG